MLFIILFFICGVITAQEKYTPLFESEETFTLDKDEGLVSTLTLNPTMLAHMKIGVEEPSMYLPIEDGKVLELILKKRSFINAEGLLIKTTDDPEGRIQQSPSFYTGIIKGRPRTMVRMGIFDGEVRCRVILEDRSGYKLYNTSSENGEEDSGSPGHYEVYRLSNEMPARTFLCESTGTGTNFKENGGALTRANGNSSHGPLTVYMELDYETYVTLGGTIEDAITEITMLFANSASYFDAISCELIENGQPTEYCVQLQLQEVFIHTSPDPYAGPTSLFFRLEDFVEGATNQNRETDLAQLINWSDVGDINGGVSNGIGNLCGGTFNPLDQNTGNPIFNPPLDMNGESIANLGTFNTEPNDGQSDLFDELIIAHELAHSMGAVHTGANAFYSFDDDNCQQHRYALELQSCGAEDNTHCDQIQNPTDPPREEPDGWNGDNSDPDEPGRTVDRLCPTTLMSNCWAFDFGPTDCAPPHDQTPLDVDDNFPIHPENAAKICEHLSECDTWGDPPCTAIVNCGSSPCPIGSMMPDADCDGVPDCCECETYVNVPNPLQSETEVIQSCDGNEQIITTTFQACDDNDPCTHQDRIIINGMNPLNCNCVGEPLNQAIGDDISGGTCINNTGRCILLNKSYAGDDAPLEGISQYPVAWSAEANPTNPVKLTTPDIIDNHVRVIKSKRQNGTSARHEGIVIPLCCPLEPLPKGRNYQLTFQAAFLGYYPDIQGTVMVQGSANPPDLSTPLNVDPQEPHNGYETIATVAIANSLPSLGMGYPLTPPNYNAGVSNPDNFNFNNFWFRGANQPNINYGMTSFTIDISVNQTTNFVYFSLATNGNQDCSANGYSGNNDFIDGLAGGGSLIMDDFLITMPEPPINLEIEKEEIDLCGGERTDNPQPVLDDVLATMECTYNVCLDDEFCLNLIGPNGVGTMADPPFCFTDNNYLWEKILEIDGSEVCPEDPGLVGPEFCIEDFSIADQGTYQLTLFDTQCDCSNSTIFTLEVEKPKPLQIAMRYSYGNECLDDVIQPITLNYITPDDCPFLICRDDFMTSGGGTQGITVDIGNRGRSDEQDYIVTRYHDVTIEDGCKGQIPSNDIISPFAGGFFDREFCEDGYFTVYPSTDDVFGTYVIYDADCPTNNTTLVIAPDDEIDLSEVLIDIDSDDCMPVVCFSYYDINESVRFHEFVQFMIKGGAGWSPPLSISDDEDNFCVQLEVDVEYTIKVRWTDGPSCCEEFPFIIDSEIEPEFDVDDQLCDTNNGGIEVLQPDPDWTFLWSNGSMESFIDCLGTGDYSLTITDILGCEHDYSFTINSIMTDVLDENGGRSGLSESDESLAQTGIKLNSGTQLHWQFKTFYIADNFKLIISEENDFSNSEFLLHTTPVTSVSMECCESFTSSTEACCYITNDPPPCSCSFWCDCANIYMASHQTTSVDFSDYSWNNQQGANIGTININSSNGCDRRNTLSGVVTIPPNAQGFYWIKAEVDGQPCNPNGPDETKWELVVTCDSNIPLVISDLDESYNNIESDIVSDKVVSTIPVVTSELFSIYPNPVISEMIIDKSNTQSIDYNLTLMNLEGKILLQTSLISSDIYTVNLSSFPPGVYLVKLLYDESSIIKRVVIQ